MAERAFSAPTAPWILFDRRVPDPRAHYRIVLPARLRALPLEPRAAGAARPVVLMGSMRALRGPALDIDVLACWQPREIAPADWLESGLASGGYEVLDRQRRPGPGGDDLLAVTRRDGPSPCVSIWRTIKQGGSMFGTIYVVEARARLDDAAKLAAEMRRSVESFTLLAPGDWPFCERLRLLTRRSPGDFSLYHPASWSAVVTREGDSEDGVLTAEILHGEQRPAGRITLMASVEVSELQSLLAIYTRSIEAGGARVSFAAPTPSPPFGGLEKTCSALGTATTPGGDTADLRVDYGSRGGVGYLLALVSVTRAAQPLVAAVNQRALALVRGTMRTHA